MTRRTDTQDPWTELQRAGEVTEDPAEALLRARVAVRRAATAESLRARVTRVRRRRLRLGAGALALVAATVVVGVVGPDLGGGDLGASPAAAAILERAADAAEVEPSPATEPGQFLRIRLVEQSWSVAEDEHGDPLVGQDGHVVATQERRTRTIWVPHESDDDWTFRERTEILRRNSTDPRHQSAPEPMRTWRQSSWSDPRGSTYLPTFDPDWYAALPRDPDQLMASIRERVGGEESGTSYLFAEVYSEVLRSGVAPADIRAALLRGLVDTPGMLVEHGVATLDGRTGTAIGHRDGHWQMVFDDATGRYLGERATSPDFPDVEGLDEDRTTWLTTVTTEVTDRAPAAQ